MLLTVSPPQTYLPGANQQRHSPRLPADAGGPVAGAVHAHHSARPGGGAGLSAPAEHSSPQPHFRRRLPQGLRAGESFSHLQLFFFPKLAMCQKKMWKKNPHITVFWILPSQCSFLFSTGVSPSVNALCMFFSNSLFFFQRLVLRASLGDFEEAQIYGSLQNGGITTTVSKKQFFFPDIRAYALVALEILGHVCQHRQKEKQPHRLVASLPDEKASGWEGSKSGSECGHVEGIAARSGSSSIIQFCAPGAPDDFKERSTRAVANSTLVMVGSAKTDDNDDARLVSKSRAHRRDKQNQGWGEMHGSRSPNVPPYDGDFGQATFSPEDSAKLPEITHVKEAYHFEFPNQSVFHSRGASENDYEEIQNIEEKLERGALYYAIARKREPARTGGYVVTRSPSGREIFLPASNNNGNHNHSRSSLVTSDSGYVGTTSSTSSQQHHATAGPHDEIDDLSEFSSAPKAAHRTTSANTISSFGDDILEVLPGMADDDDDLRRGDRTRREIIRERGEARIEQILDSYQERVRRGGLDGGGKDWPKLKFSRIMNGQATSAGNPRTQRTVTTPTTTSTSPRYQQQATVSPRPKTAVTPGVKRIDKVRPLSASSLTPASWNARNSFRKKKARTELSRALSKSRTFAKPSKDRGERRGEGAKQVERKYASHNSAYVHDEVRDLVTIEDAAGAANSAKLVTAERNTSNGEHSGQSRQPSKTEENVSSPQESFNRELEAREQENRPSQPLRHHPQVKHVRGQNGSSFSSDDSFSSYCQVSGNSRDVSLTSGELTSASSQAGSPVHRGHDSNGGPPGDRNEDINGSVTAHTQEVIPELVPGMKFVDSGFDEDSVSVASDEDEEEPLADDLSAEACTCSCGSEVTTGSDACTCTCSRCRGSTRGSHPPWSETQSSGSWSNSNSFSSYDVQMHRRKLSSRRTCHEEHVLGPDEQYPADAKSQTHSQTTVPPAHAEDLRHHGRHHHYQHHHHHHHFHHHTHHNSNNDTHSQSGSGCSKGSSISSSAALRRYRELTRKGVPLRVSVVDEGASKVGGGRQGKPPCVCCEQREAGSEKGEEDGGRVLDASLYQDLESQGFFDSTDSASSKNSPTHSRILRRHPRMHEATSAKRLEVVQGGHVPYTRYSDLPSLPLLEDIIREIPDETSCSGDESKTFISRPASDVCLKILRGSTEDALAGEPRVHETELVIDKLFSRAQPLGAKGTDIFVHPILGLDENALRELAASASEVQLSDEGPEKDLHLALLQGTDLRHVRYAKALAEKVDLLTVHDLFPADPRTFDTLRWRLQHTGSFGSIGLKVRN